MAYTTNLCINPSFQQGLLGVKKRTGNETIAIDTTEKIFSTQSLLVTLPGKGGGEGVYLPGGVIPQAANCSVSLYLYGQGNFVVSAILDADGSSFLVETNSPTPDTDAVVLASLPVAVTSSWQRVVINNLYIGVPGQVVYLSVYSTTPQATVVWVSGIQIEPESPAQPYIDGDLDDAQWVDLPYGRSIFPRLHQFHLTGTTVDTGNTIIPLATGLVATSTVINTASHAVGDLIPVGFTAPVGAMTDFAIWSSADPDPAMAYVSWNNTGLTVPNTGTSYGRSYATFIPSLDYLNSTGLNTWNRAAYIAAGFQFSGLPNNAWATLDDVQVELLPIPSNVPSSYILPRQISSIIKPDRLNFVPNPSFETGTTNWSGVGGGTLSQDTQFSASTVISFDEGQQTAGTNSLQVNCTTAGDGTSINLTNLIPGNQYIASAYVSPGQGISNITMSCSGSFTTLAQTGGVGYGLYGYGTDPRQPYGGISGPGADVNPNLISLADQGMETWTGDWTPYFFTTSVAQSITQAHTGTHSALVTADGTANNAGMINSAVIPVTPGQTIVLSAWLYTSTASRRGLFSVFTYNNSTGAGSPGTIFSNNTNLTVNTWSYIKAEITIPAGVFSIKFNVLAAVVGGGNMGVSELTYIDDVKINILTWYRLWFTFIANSDTVTLSFVSSFAADFLDPTYFWVDAVLVELGQLLQNYFDASFSALNYYPYEFSWTGASAGAQVESHNNQTPALPSTSYSGGFYVWASQPYSPGVQLGIAFYGASSWISTVQSPVTALTTTPQVIWVPNAVSPPGTTRIDIAIHVQGGSPAGTTFYVQPCPVQPGNNPVTGTPGSTGSAATDWTATNTAAISPVSGSTQETSQVVNYFWDGTPGSSRSYYYKQFGQRFNAWGNTLAKHVPLGISYSTPQTATPYGQ